MIIKRVWQRPKRTLGLYTYVGWFLFGFIPLYIERRGV